VASDILQQKIDTVLGGPQFIIHDAMKEEIGIEVNVFARIGDKQHSLLSHRLH